MPSNNKKKQSIKLTQTLSQALALSIDSDRDLYQAHTASQNYLLKLRAGNQDTKVELESFKQNSVQALQRLNQARGILHNNVLVERELAPFENDYNQWLTSAQKMLTLADDGNLTEAIRFNDSVLQHQFLRLRKHYDVMGEIAQHLLQEANN